MKLLKITINVLLTAILAVQNTKNFGFLYSQKAIASSYFECYIFLTPLREFKRKVCFLPRKKSVSEI